MTSVPPFLWVLLKSNNSAAVKVSTAGCVDIADFIDAIKNKLPNQLKFFDANVISLHLTNDGPALEPDAALPGQNKMESSLIVKVPPTNLNRTGPYDSANRTTFVEYLKLGGIDRPKSHVLQTIGTRYSQQLQAVLSIGHVSSCVDLYRTVEVLPATFTRGVIEGNLNISINGPLSLAQPNILIAADMESGVSLLIKLLRMPETTASYSTDIKQYAIIAEINNCTTLLRANIVGLVKCNVVEVTVQHTDNLNVSAGKWKAIKMHRYMSSLCDFPQLSEKLLYRGFTRIFNALKAMHELNLVHMDVKSDNVFVDNDGNWDMGDFGSTRTVGENVWSITDVLNPYTIPSNATVIPAMDYVLLCVMIAIQLKKDKWIELCDKQQNVQAHLVVAMLNTIKEKNFKDTLVALFEQNLQIVLDHLKKF